ncbi:ilvB operon leader peptide IvbL [Escherichia coli]
MTTSMLNAKLLPTAPSAAVAVVVVRVVVVVGNAP